MYNTSYWKTHYRYLQLSHTSFSHLGFHRKICLGFVSVKPITFLRGTKIRFSLEECEYKMIVKYKISAALSNAKYSVIL